MTITTASAFTILMKEKPDEKDGAALSRQRLQALLEALLNYLKLVVITLDEGDDAQVIFDTFKQQE